METFTYTRWTFRHGEEHAKITETLTADDLRVRVGVATQEAFLGLLLAWTRVAARNAKSGYLHIYLPE